MGANFSIHRFIWYDPHPLNITSLIKLALFSNCVIFRSMGKFQTIKAGHNSVTRFNYWCVMLDEYLSWKCHLNAPCMHQNSCWSCLHKRFILTRNILLTLYNCIVLHHYCNVTWGLHFKSSYMNVNKQVILQKEKVRMNANCIVIDIPGKYLLNFAISNQAIQGISSFQLSGVGLYVFSATMSSTSFLFIYVSLLMTKVSLLIVKVKLVGLHASRVTQT